MFAAVCDPTADAEKLLRLAQEFSPWVERTTADTIAFDADGLERIYGLPQEIAATVARRAAECGLKAGIAIAANLDAAVHAARGFAGVSVIPHGDEAKFLGSLPLALLEPTPEMQETLERWGIRRFRDLAALPALGLAERLGPEGLRLHQLACGAGDRPLVPVDEPLHFEEEFELEYPVELLEPLVFVLARLLRSLCAAPDLARFGDYRIAAAVAARKPGRALAHTALSYSHAGRQCVSKIAAPGSERASAFGAGGACVAGSGVGQAARRTEWLVSSPRA